MGPLKLASFLLQVEAEAFVEGGCPLPAVKANCRTGSLSLPAWEPRGWMVALRRAKREERTPDLANPLPWLSLGTHPLHPLHPCRALTPTLLLIQTPAYTCRGSGLFPSPRRMKPLSHFSPPSRHTPPSWSPHSPETLSPPPHRPPPALCPQLSLSLHSLTVPLSPLSPAPWHPEHWPKSPEATFWRQHPEASSRFVGY